MMTRLHLSVIAVFFGMLVLFPQTALIGQAILSPSYAVVIAVTAYERPQFWRKLPSAVPDAKHQSDA